MDSQPRKSQQPVGSGPSGSAQPPRLSGSRWLVILGAVFLFNLVFYGIQFAAGLNSQTAQISIPYSTLTSQIHSGNIASANVSGDTVSGDFKHAYESKGKSYPRFTSTIRPELLTIIVPQLDSNKVKTSIVSSAVPAWEALLSILLQALPLLFFVGLFYYGSRAARAQQQGVFGFGQSRAKLYNEERPSTTFADVAGVDAAKGELTEIVDFLREPAKYSRLGARIPKGVLLVGPPGTGKTLLARAVAGEARVPFYSISATEFVELFVGVGASRVRDLFDRARQNAPCIVFIDEIDAIGGQRGGRGPLSGGNDEREQTLNQILVSMDGFEPAEAVIVLAATNRPDVLDPALLRPGRFDRQVTVDLPDRRGRESILKIHTRNIPLGSDVQLGTIAQATPGMSGADLANLANEAALAAARRGESQVFRADFEEALDRITLGLEGAPLMNKKERRLVAYHEGGHALVATILPDVDPVHRVTITPRGRSLGVTQFRPIDDRRNYPREYLLNRLAVGLGGRAAEEVATEDITSGAQNDLQQITGMARSMVMQLGMADELGPIYFGGSSDGNGGGGSSVFEAREYSDDTARRIDMAVSRLVQEAHDKARAVLVENRSALDAIADTLMREESITREELTAIINAHRAPGQPQLAVPTGDPTPIGEAADQETAPV